MKYIDFFVIRHSKEKGAPVVEVVSEGDILSQGVREALKYHDTYRDLSFTLDLYWMDDPESYFEPRWEEYRKKNAITHANIIGRDGSLFKAFPVDKDGAADFIAVAEKNCLGAKARALVDGVGLT
jgi:hypothetical protein